MGREYVEELKNRVLNGGAEITYDEALKLAHEDLDILAASANEIREYFCGDRCDVCSVISVKEGRCTENCRYCAQSRIAKKDIPEINLLGNEAVTEGASIDYDKGSFRYCLVAEGRRLSKREVELAEKTVKDIHDNVDINICASFGLLDQDDFTKLKGAGLTTCIFSGGVHQSHPGTEEGDNTRCKGCGTHGVQWQSVRHGRDS